MICQDTTAYGVDLKYADEPVEGPRGRARTFLDLAQRARRARRLGAAALRLSLSARRRGHPADGRGQGPALSRHPVPARLARGAQGDAPPGASGEDARAHPRAGARSAPTSPSARPSSSASPARPRRISRSARLARRGAARPRRLLPATSRSTAPPANDLAGAVPEEVKEERWHRFMAGAAGGQRASCCKAKVGTTPRRSSSTRPGATVAKGRSQVRRARDRRRGLCRVTPPPAGRRDRHRQDRARRRIRSARDGGLSRKTARVRQWRCSSPASPPLPPCPPTPAPATLPCRSPGRRPRSRRLESGPAARRAPSRRRRSRWRGPRRKPA